MNEDTMRVEVAEKIREERGQSPAPACAWFNPSPIE
jgi:hypothetical protein